MSSFPRAKREQSVEIERGHDRFAESRLLIVGQDADLLSHWTSLGSSNRRGHDDEKLTLLTGNSWR